MQTRIVASTALLSLAALLVLSPAPAAPSGPAAGGEQAADAFVAALARHCGHAYAGRIVANEPAAANDPFEGKALVMHVRECGQGTIRVPFHVGDDHSRTWVLTRTAGGLRLKHDHRHPDGKPDKLTMYGGDTATPGTASRQEFPADAETKALFEREGLAVSLTNVWAMEVDPGHRFVYELARPGRLFRVEFDLSSPVPEPPAPWGAASEAAITRTWKDVAVSWAPCPDVFPAGCEIAVLHGNPGKPNADIFFKVPGGYRIPYHWHSSAERMVLVNGELHVTYDGQATAILRPGTYAYGPAGAPHTAECHGVEPCVLFIAFEGPVDVQTGGQKP